MTVCNYYQWLGAGNRPRINAGVEFVGASPSHALGLHGRVEHIARHRAAIDRIVDHDRRKADSGNGLGECNDRRQVQGQNQHAPNASTT